MSFNDKCRKNKTVRKNISISGSVPEKFQDLKIHLFYNTFCITKVIFLSRLTIIRETYDMTDTELFCTQNEPWDIEFVRINGISKHYDYFGILNIDFYFSFFFQSDYTQFNNKSLYLYRDNQYTHLYLW